MRCTLLLTPCGQLPLNRIGPEEGYKLWFLKENRLWAGRINRSGNHRRTITGSRIGGIRETQAVPDFCAGHSILPQVEIIPIPDINNAFEHTARRSPVLLHDQYAITQKRKLSRIAKAYAWD